MIELIEDKDLNSKNIKFMFYEEKIPFNSKTLKITSLGDIGYSDNIVILEAIEIVKAKSNQY